MIKKEVLFISLLKHHPPCPFGCINFLLLWDQLPCIIAVPNIVKPKEPQKRSFPFTLLKIVPEKMGKEENAHFLLVEGGCEQLSLPLVKVIFSCWVIFRIDENDNFCCDSYFLLEYKLIQGRTMFFNSTTPSCAAGYCSFSYLFLILAYPSQVPAYGLSHPGLYQSLGITRHLRASLVPMGGKIRHSAKADLIDMQHDLIPS